MNTRQIATSGLLSLLTFSCEDAPSTPETDEIVQDEFTDGFGPLRGHEDILRFGIQFANILLESEYGVTQYFAPVPYGEACDSSHAMLHGNCVTDSPDSTMTNYYGASASSWQFNGALMDLHFLRDYYGSGVYGAQASCQRSRDRISNAAILAAEKWQAGDPRGAEYWLGHATHIIQDSFSAAHTNRTGTLLRSLRDVCTYARSVSGVCYHKLVDSRDRVWRGSLSCQLNPNNRSWGCLTPQAQSAAYATAGFLRVFGRHVESGYSTVLQSELDAYFDWASDDFTGFHSCVTLP